MASSTVILLIVRSSRPSFRSKHDRVVFGIHAFMLADGYQLVAVGDSAEQSISGIDELKFEEVDIEGWNESSGSFHFCYTDCKGNQPALAFNAQIEDDGVACHWKTLGSSKIPTTIHLKVADYTTDATGLTEGYKNLDGLIAKLRNCLSNFQLDPATHIQAGLLKGPDWNDLPPELLLKIADSSRGTSAMRWVSRSWKAGLDSVSSQLCIRGSTLPPSLPARFPSLTSLDLRGCPFVTPQGLQALHQLQSLRSLALRMGPRKFFESFVEALRGLSQIARLDVDLRRLGWPRLADPRLRMLQGLPVLKLDLYEQRLKPASLALLRGFAEVTALVLPKNCPCGDTDLEALRDLPLKSLQLTHAHNLTDAFLGTLRGKPLSELDLGCSHRFSDSGLSALRGLPLTKLDLGGPKWDGPPFSDRGLEALQGLPLTDLDLGYANDIMTDVGLQALRDMPLKRLRLGFNGEFSDVGFAALRGMSLTALDIGCCDDNYFSDTALGLLRGMPMTVLDIGWGRFTEAMVALLFELPLKELGVHSGITDESLKALRGMRLEELRLFHSREVTDVGLKALDGMPALVTLNVVRCEHVSDKAIAEFWERRFLACQREKLELEKRFGLQ